MPEPLRHNAVVYIKTPRGIIFIQDPKKPEPLFWKLPGGGQEARETPEETAVREIFEELGLRIDPQRLVLVRKQLRRDDHFYYVFRIVHKDLRELRAKGDEGERIAFFSKGKVRRNRELFLPWLLDILEEEHLI